MKLEVGVSVIVGDTRGGKLDIGGASGSLFDAVGGMGGAGALKPSSGGVVGIDDAEVGLFEKSAFSGAIISKSAVIVEMVVSEVGKDSDFNRDAESAELSDGVRGDF